MNILHVVHTYPPSMGGSQWLVKNLSEQLVTRYNDTVTVFTTNAYHTEYFWSDKGAVMPAGTESINGVTVRRFAVFNKLSTVRMLLAGAAYRLRLPYNDWLRTLYNGPIVPGLARAIAESDADVVFATAFPLLHMYHALAGARQAGIPIVFLGAIHTAEEWGYNRSMIYRAIQQADAYIAHTTFERDYLVRRGIDPSRISIVGAGVDSDTLNKGDGTKVREQYSWHDAPVVTMLAKQTERKRFDVLLEAMQHVWRVVPDARLLLAGGRTPYSARIDDMIQALPTERQDHVVVVSDFSEQDKADLLAACDVFVLSSGHESFGIAFVEAWACARPVIGTRSGAIPSVIAEGHDGLLAEYGDGTSLAQAILSLLADPKQRARMGQAGKKKVQENYTWDIVTDRVRAIYDGCTQSRKHTHQANTRKNRARNRDF
ncbi:MAG: glycosyltransferase family 4 protein [Anaerolineae bacterium]|nr:glycosyltransferase family 4 protein [Anaerolineae bacterium]